MYEYFVVLLGQASPVPGTDISSLSVIDTFSVSLEPFPCIGQSFLKFRLDVPIRHRSYVQQEIGAVTAGPYQGMDQLFRCFISCIGDVESPGGIDGFAGLQGHLLRRRLITQPGFILPWEITFEHLKVFSRQGCKMVIVADEALWLQAMDQGIDLTQVPVDPGGSVGCSFRGRLVPIAVKPDASDLPIVGKQFRQLVLPDLNVLFPFTMHPPSPTYPRTPRPPVTATPSPLQERIIQE